MSEPPLSDSEIEQFMNHALTRAGAEELITPREIIRDYLTLLNILRDNKELRFSELLRKLNFDRDSDESGMVTEGGYTGDAAPTQTSTRKIDLFDIEL